MRILILHSRYLSGNASGENRVVDDEAELLARAGHHVDVWSPSASELHHLPALRLAARSVWSTSAVREIKQRIAAQQIEIAHFHNVFPMLSPASIVASGSSRAATVVTLHNYRLMCLPATLLREGRSCEECVGRFPWRGVVHRCYRGSLAGSTVLASSLAVHRLRRTYGDVDLFLPVSRFVLEKHAEAGFTTDNMIVKSNFAWPSNLRRGPGEYFLFIGRLSPEKGIDRLIRVWPNVGLPLRVVGGGPLEPRLRQLASPNVEFLGAVTPDEVQGHLASARALIVPSPGSDASPRAVLEAYASGVPVLATDAGGLPELVEPDVSGYVLPRSNEDSWASLIAKLTDDAASLRLGAGALALWTRQFGPDKALVSLENAYTVAMEHKATNPAHSPKVARNALATDKTVGLQIAENNQCAVERRPTLRFETNRRVRRHFVRVGNAREGFDLPQHRFRIETLRISRHADLERSRNVDADERAFLFDNCLSLASRLLVR